MIDPVACHLGPLTIRWYGLCVAAGFASGYTLAQTRASRVGLPAEAPGDLVVGAMVGGIVGARLLYVLQNWREEFSGRVLDVLKIYQGGLVFYGGFLGAFLVILFLCRRRHWPYLLVGDLLAPCLPLGHAFGRVGCFLNGCCFGRPHTGLLSIHYPGLVDGMINGPLYVQRQQGLVAPDTLSCLPVFPIQLVSSLANLTLAIGLIALGRRKAWHGRLFPAYLVGFGCFRFLIEFGRGDYFRHYAGLTSAQWTCLCLVLAGGVWLRCMRGRHIEYPLQAKTVDSEDADRS